MANFIQFARAEDSDMVTRMKIIMDLIWADIATQSYKYTDADGNTQYAFMSASGRMYMDNKSSDDTGNRLRPYVNLILGNGEDHKTESNRFFICFKRMYEATVNGGPLYRVPDVIKAIFNDGAPERTVKSSNGISIEELVKDGFVGDDVGQIMMQMGMEAFSNAAVIDNSISYLRTNKLFKNEFLNDFKLVNLLSKGDVAVTQDYALAAMGLSRGARIINQNGLEYTEFNIDSLLMSRFIAKKRQNLIKCIIPHIFPQENCANLRIICLPFVYLYKVIYYSIFKLISIVHYAIILAHWSKQRGICGV